MGNYYGRHDGYDGSVFHPNGLCKTITHSVGGVADIITPEQNRTEQNRTEQNRTEQNRTEFHTIDLSVKRPKEIEIANCIKARYDCGISNLQSDGSGVIERERYSV